MGFCLFLFKSVCFTFCGFNFCVLQGVWHGTVIIILTLICREMNSNDNLNSPYNALSLSLSRCLFLISLFLIICLSHYFLYLLFMPSSYWWLVLLFLLIIIVKLWCDVSNQCLLINVYHHIVINTNTLCFHRYLSASLYSSFEFSYILPNVSPEAGHLSL